MPTKLKDLHITKVDMVDQGANQDAHFLFAKRKPDESAGDDTTQSPIAKALRAFIDLFKMNTPADIAKAAEAIAKDDARTFNEVNLQEKISSEVYDLTWPLNSSLISIVRDTEKTAEEKLALFDTTMQQFSDILKAAYSNWAKGLSSKIIQKNAPNADDLAILAEIHGIMGAAIGKSAPALETIQENTEPKGATDMEFDTEKMTPAEKVAFEDLKKRYGKDGAPAAPVAPIADTAQSVENAPVVKALQTQNQEMSATIKTLTDQLETTELTGVAKRYEVLGKKPEDLVPVLKSMKLAGKEVYDAYIGGLDEQVKLVEKSGLFTEIGKRGTVGNSGDAWGQIEGHATEIMKSKADMTRAAAIDLACQQRPELVAAYEQSR